MGVVVISSSAMPTDRAAIDTGRFTATFSQFEVAPEPGGWHHHGDHNVVAYVMSGRVVIESGLGGGILTEPSPGDLVHIEPGTIHRETYEGQIALVGFSVGSGPGRVDVDGPEWNS